MRSGTCPFDDPAAEYLVLTNQRGQQCPWPVANDVPNGWDVVYGPAGRDDCLGFASAAWAKARL